VCVQAPTPPQAGGGSTTPRTAKNVNVRVSSGDSGCSSQTRDEFQRRQAERDARMAEARKEEAEDRALIQARRLKKFQRDRDPETFPETETEMSSVAPPPPPTTPHPVGARVVQVKDERVHGIIDSFIDAGQYIYTVAFLSPIAESLLPDTLAGHFLFNDEGGVTGLSSLVHESIELEVEVDEEVSVASLIL
jgi:hypothetical protein